MTLEEWNSNPNLAESLAADLEKTHWVAALSVLESLSYAKTAMLLPITSITGHGDALSGKVSGYEKAIQNIRAIARPQAKIQTSLTEPDYGIIDKSQATE